MRGRTILFALGLGLIAVPAGAVDGEGPMANDPYGLRHYLVHGEKDQHLPFGFLKRALGHYRVEFADPPGGAGAAYWPSSNTLTVRAALGSGGRLRPFSQIGVSDRATIYHEMFHGYLDWARDTGGDRFATDYFRTNRCRYADVEVDLPNGPTRWQLDARQQEEILEETAGVFVGKFVTDWGNAIGYVTGGPPARADMGRQGAAVRAEMLGRMREWADQRKVTGYFKCGGGWPVSGCPGFFPSLVFMTARNAMTTSEMSFLVGGLMGFPAAEVARFLPSGAPPACPTAGPGRPPPPPVAQPTPTPMPVRPQPQPQPQPTGGGWQPIN